MGVSSHSVGSVCGILGGIFFYRLSGILRPFYEVSTRGTRSATLRDRAQRRQRPRFFLRGWWGGISVLRRAGALSPTW